MDAITNLNSSQHVEPSPSRDITGPKNDVLREACRGVEGMFISILLKQGLRTDSLNDEGEGGFNGSLQEFAIEQTASEIGQEGVWGIADMIYEQISSHTEASVPTAGTLSTQKGLYRHAK